MRVDSKLACSLQKGIQNHGRLIIAFDFDNTVFPLSGDDEVCLEVRDTLRLAQEQGHVLICYTCRSEEEEVLKFCQGEGIYYERFNENHLQLDGQHGKVYYNIFLDDKCGLQMALSTLQEVLRFNSKEKNYDSTSSRSGWL